jgi:hypothetical protein
MTERHYAEQQKSRPHSNRQRSDERDAFVLEVIKKTEREEFSKKDIAVLLRAYPDKRDPGYLANNAFRGLLRTGSIERAERYGYYRLARKDGTGAVCGSGANDAEPQVCSIKYLSMCMADVTQEEADNALRYCERNWQGQHCTDRCGFRITADYAADIQQLRVCIESNAAHSEEDAEEAMASFVSTLREINDGCLECRYDMGNLEKAVFGERRDAE